MTSLMSALRVVAVVVVSMYIHLIYMKTLMKEISFENLYISELIIKMSRHNEESYLSKLSSLA